MKKYVETTDLVVNVYPMARPLPPELAGKADWNSALIYFCRGDLTHAEIAEKCFVTVAALRKKITRSGWLELKAKTAPVAVVPQRNSAEEFRQHGEETREILGECLAQAVDALGELPEPKKLRELTNHVKAVGKIAETASVVFGWGDGKLPTRTLNIDLLRYADTAKLESQLDEMQSANPSLRSNGG